MYIYTYINIMKIWPPPGTYFCVSFSLLLMNIIMMNNNNDSKKKQQQ